MLRFLGCMILGIITYSIVILCALLFDFSIFKKMDPAKDLRELWEISTGSADAAH